MTKTSEQIRSPVVGGIHRLAIRSFPFQLVLVFMAALIVFLVLRSPDYLAVDGALRALQVYYLHRPFLHPNNHLLYAVNLYIWSTMLRLVGIVEHDPISFLRLAQGMNSVAAAACLTVFYGLTCKVTNRIALSASVTTGLGFSSAFLAHATNSAEPMVGLLWSEIAVVLAAYGFSRRMIWASVSAGLLLALAMAAYQSMVLFGIPIVIMLWQSTTTGADRNTAWRTKIVAARQFVVGFALGIPIIYGTAYYLSGTRTVTGMLGRFLQLDGSSQVYGGVSLIKFASVLPGLAISLFPCLPRECGFRCLNNRQYVSWVPVAVLAILVGAVCLVAMAFLTAKLWPIMTATERVGITCSAAGLFSTILPVISWMPTYDKLWLQPLVCLFFAGGVLVSVALRHPNLPYVRHCGYCLIVAIALSNVARAVSVDTKPTPYMNEAIEVAAMVTPQDLLIGDWNSIFLLYQAFWAPRANSFNVPTIAQREGLKTIPRLTEMIERTTKSGGCVYFLGILDLSKQDWKMALEDKGGIAYADFEGFRSRAATIRSFSSGARVITLRRLSK
jgi:hypothetical protein